MEQNEINEDLNLNKTDPDKLSTQVEDKNFINVKNRREDEPNELQDHDPAFSNRKVSSSRLRSGPITRSQLKLSNL